jgi:hypothetical protein
MLLVAFFAASTADAAGATITSTLRPDQVGREIGQPLNLSLGPSILDDDVLAFNPAETP